MTDERERRLRQLMEAAGESTKAGAIDVAVRHYLADRENKRDVVADLPDGAVEELSTPWLPMEREVEHQVGRAEE